MHSCVCHFFFVPLYPQMIKNVVSMRKILSLLSSLFFALSLWAETTNVAVSMYRVEPQAKGVMYQLLNENMSRMYIFPIENLPEGATDVEYGKTYSLSDMNQYSYWIEQSTYTYAMYTSASFKVTANEAGKIRIDAQVTDQRGDTYILLYDEAAVPEMPKGGTFVADTITTQSGSKIVEYALEMENPLFAFVFDFVVAEGETDIQSGVTYTMEDLYGYPNSLGYYYYKPSIMYKSVSFVKTLAADGSYTINATVVDENDYTWNLSGSKAAPPNPTEQHLEFDTSDEDFDFNFTSYDLNLDNLVNGYAVLTAYDTENMKMAYLQFWTKPGVDKFVAAVYPIDYSQANYTVNASTGAQGEGMTPSFVATLTNVSDTYYPNQLWLLVTGTVTVREDGLIIIEGQNSYGRTVKAVLYPDGYQALDNLKTDPSQPRKVLENGQILIIQNNRKFSITGNPVY